MNDIPLLQIDDLAVTFETRGGTVEAVRDVSFRLQKGEALGIVGESGSGKSVTSYAAMKILDRNGTVASGSITFGGMDLGTASEAAMSDLRGREMSMIFQDPRSALNPIRTVGRQIEDVLLRHSQATRHDVRAKAVEMLRKVRIARPEERYHAYPFELSGGMCQRVVIAIALACDPQLLIADEPTTGLDVTTQKAVMDLADELRRQSNLSMLLITHDLGLAATYCDRIVVMEKGRIVETAPARSLFDDPQHPYTRRLIAAMPRRTAGLRDLLPTGDAERGTAPAAWPATAARPLLEISGLTKTFAKKRGLPGRLLGKAEPPAPAVDDISFTLDRGESLGLVGESGCGKSTTSSMIMRLLDPTAGEIVFDGERIDQIPRASFARSPLRARMQMVFQDHTASLNPRFTARRSIADPILRLGRRGDGRSVDDRVAELADRVSLPQALLDRFPHQLSGGQKARVGIARAIALSPDLLILDEPTAALDVSVQAVVLNLLADLRAEMGLSYLFISHDLEVVRLLCDRVIVMRGGVIVEEGATTEVLTDPKDAYTRELIDAIPTIEPRDPRPGAAPAAAAAALAAR
ncbi:dipeptide ABC transporter ATP-binding protein [Jiella avicenniae]|uniref:ABC transporter ATP-binding protein n=1 Tax=Jiella avicenniae TaxID=2907202 RepID=A0A9X1NZS8_9HYPH|nr:ABC transporter ATP-binding protein [Jiella avicenniae]MCE7027710.1 ABC transporter ATP-binding protein [Jiella avicenniae]MCE7028752.1 ABC transporter ATP-binding protein [Jiella avicenniae]